MTLSVIIPTLNAGDYLSATITSLGKVDDVIVVDGGSSNGTLEIATRLGARSVVTSANRGLQLCAGAAVACGTWLLFLHADTILEGGWRDEADKFMCDPSNSTRAAAFRFALDDKSSEAERLEKLVAWRVRMLGLPYGDQGLLISRDFYQSLGGYRAWPLMEDVDFVRRIGRRRLTVFRSAARTSAERWRRDGWKRRSVRNLACLSLYFAGVPPQLLARLYD